MSDDFTVERDDVPQEIVDKAINRVMKESQEKTQEELAKEIGDELASVLRRTKELKSEEKIEKYLASLDDAKELSDSLRNISFGYGPGIMDAIPSWMVRHDWKTGKDPLGEIDRDAALALLLINEVIFTNTNWWEDTWPEDAKNSTYLGVNINDVFAWGVSDFEAISIGEIPALFAMWEKDPRWGSTVWAIIKRNEMPQRPIEKSIRESGKWDLDALKQEHQLKSNYYDGYSSVTAKLKYERYVAWCQGRGVEPLPFDASWWNGWCEFMKENPTWYDNEWKKEEFTRLNKWREENGYEVLT